MIFETMAYSAAWAPRNIGLVLTDRQTGREIYVQPGDGTNAMLANIDAIREEVAEDKKSAIFDMILGDYFA